MHLRRAPVGGEGVEEGHALARHAHIIAEVDEGRDVGKYIVRQFGEIRQHRHVRLGSRSGERHRRLLHRTGGRADGEA